jgi:ubiquinone/menaquinone biosynthesis C-methylase UbiE
MTWHDSDSLSDLRDCLGPQDIVDAAIAIENGRSVEAEEQVLSFHELSVTGLITTPFMYQAGLAARESGCTTFNGLERQFLPAKEGWVHPTLQPSDYQCRLDRDRLASSKSWPFMQDCPMGDFQVNTSPKWWSHGLVHALTGFGFWPSMSEWDVMLMARLGEMVASLHWYWFAELGREYCPLHSVASGDATPDCEACRRLEAEALLQDVRLERLRSEASLAIATNALQILHYEDAAYEQGRNAGVLLQPRGRYLDLGEAADYALFHHRRLVGSDFQAYVEACLRPQLDYATSLEMFEEQAVQAIKTLLTPCVLTPVDASLRARRVLQDLGSRVIHGASYDRALACVGEGLEGLEPGMNSELCDQRVASVIENLASQDVPAETFQLGYRPILNSDLEPDVSRAARATAYLERVEASGSPVRYFMARAPVMVERLINQSRSAGLVDEIVSAATTAPDTDNMRELMIQAVLGWLQVAAESWGPDNALPHIGRQWVYRIAHRTVPPREAWDTVRLRPNPYLDSVPVPFDIKWLDKVVSDPTCEFKPKSATRVHYVMVGQGRKHPLFIPFTQTRKRLLNALQETPSMSELVAQGFSEDALRQALNEELVVAIQHNEKYTLYMSPMANSITSSSTQPQDSSLPAEAEIQNPWDEDEQARYYENYCKDSTLYQELADATIAFAGLADSARAADLGCGSGVSTRALLANGCQEVLAIDPSTNMLTACARNVMDPRVELHLGKAEHLPLFLKDSPLNAVLCNSAFWLDGDMQGAMAAIANALGPHGKFGMSIPAEFLGHYEHRLGKEAEHFFGAVTRARERFRVSFDEKDTQPQSPLLGDATRFLEALESSGFHEAEYTVWTFEWTAGEYLKWLSQPTLIQSMTPGLEDDQRIDFMKAIADGVDTNMPMTSDWCLIRAHVTS